MSLFDQLEQAERLRDEGIRATAEDNVEWLRTVRREAVRLSAKHGEVSSVELRQWCEERNYFPFSPNAWGAIFSGPQWHHVGWRKAEHAQGHARDVKVWKYVGTRAHLKMEKNSEDKTGIYQSADREDCGQSTSRNGTRYPQRQGEGAH